MKNMASTYNMRIQLDTHQCRLDQAEVDRMMACLPALGEVVRNFPVADLHVLVEHNGRGKDYAVKTSLVLPGETLVSNEHDAVAHGAFERCLGNLVASVQAYKGRLGNTPERRKQEKGTHQSLQATEAPDGAAVDEAVREGDYARFRTATLGYEEPVRKRVGRWVERYPEVVARIDKGLKIADIEEEVFLQAFEAYEKRPRDMRFGEWLEGLIDPAIKVLLRNGDDELENINLVRAAREAEGGR